MSTNKLSNYLKMYRKRLGLTQREMAYLLGCGHGSKVSRYEREKRVPSLITLLAYEFISRRCARELFAGVYASTVGEVRTRVKRLMKQLDAQPFTAVVKRKFESLTEIIYPTSNSRNHKHETNI